MNANDQKYLKHWFQCQQRDLPWRDNPSPYAVWVSEVMLQQTQVSVVIPYFERWMKRYPSIQALASTDIDEVLKDWEGLGYYSRARNLHAGAQYVIDHYQGRLPDSPEHLAKIKGLGTYTIGAILSFAFHQRMAAVDGNVVRVLTRYFAIADDIAKTPTIKRVRDLAQELLPEKESWIISEALIELGATICTRQPKCIQCPLKGSCKSFLQGITNKIPFKSTKTSITNLYRAVAVITSQGQILISRGQKGKVMADLCEFPYFEVDEPAASIKLIENHMKEKLGLKPIWKQKLTQVKHSFTRYQALLMPHHFNVDIPKPVPGYEWLSLDSLKKLPFAGGHRSILTEVNGIHFGDRSAID